MTEPTQPTPAPKDRTDGVRVSLPPDARPQGNNLQKPIPPAVHGREHAEAAADQRHRDPRRTTQVIAGVLLRRLKGVLGLTPAGRR